MAHSTPSALVAIQMRRIVCGMGAAMSAALLRGRPAQDNTPSLCHQQSELPWVGVQRARHITVPPSPSFNDRLQGCQPCDIGKAS